MFDTASSFPSPDISVAVPPKQRYARSYAHPTENVAPTVDTAEPNAQTSSQPRVPSLIRSAAAQADARNYGTFFAKAAFQGVVTAIDAENEVFATRLWRMSGYVPTQDMPDASDADGTFPIEAVAEDDLPLLEVGSVFTWMTGYREGKGIPRKWESNLQFRRLPERSETEIQKLSVGADEYLKLFVQP